MSPVESRGAVSYTTGFPKDWRGHSSGDFSNSPTAKNLVFLFKTDYEGNGCQEFCCCSDMFCYAGQHTPRRVTLDNFMILDSAIHAQQMQRATTVKHLCAMTGSIAMARYVVYARFQIQRVQILSIFPATLDSTSKMANAHHAPQTQHVRAEMKYFIVMMATIVIQQQITNVNYVAIPPFVKMANA